ncbi:MAG: CheR family methyltransferase [Kofleriaceae bacterium]
MSLAPNIVAGVARRLAEHAGLELPAWVVEARTRARMAQLGLDPASYLELIATPRGATELAALVEAVRVGESSLFRHLPQIAALIQIVVPSLRAKNKRSVRVWSAGCATGEEPYTLAAVLSRNLPGVQVTVIATDVSSEALARARSAVYPADELRDVPEEWRDIFVVDGDTLEVHPSIASLVSFEQANLLDTIPPKSCDLVWCRNVLIYFTADARRRVVDRLIASLVPGGYVFVGYSETLRDIPQLETIRHGDCVFYAKRDREPTNPGVDPYRASLAQSCPTPAPGKSSPSIAVPTSSGKSSPKLPVWDPRSSPDSSVSTASSPPTRSSSSSNLPRATSPSSVRLALAGQPSPQQLSAMIGERLSLPNIERLVIELDSAEMLSDELAPVLRRARAASTQENVVIEFVATKPGTKRWLSRHGLSEDT